MGKLWHPTTWRDRHIQNGIVVFASSMPGIEKEQIKYMSDEYFDLLGVQPRHDNIVTDEGEGWFLDLALRNQQNDLTGFELLLSTSGTLVEASVYADRSELADGDGYAAKAVARGTGGWTAPTGTNPVSVTTPTAGTHDWTASANWASPVEQQCIVTTGAATNRLIAFSDLGGGSGRTILNGDTLSVDFDLQAGGT